MQESSKRVVVGVDGTSESQIALRWAVEAARTGGLAVRVVRAYLNQASEWPATAEGSIPEPPVDQYQAELDAAVEFVRDRLGYQAGSGWLVHAGPVDAILTEAADAQMVVVGTKFDSKLTAAVLGSVASTVTAKAPCPVVVVRGEARNGPILVGMDGSADSEDAVAFAFEQAARSDAPLTVAYCWQPQERHDAPITEMRALLQDWLVENIGTYADKYPGVAVRTRIIEGRPATALAELTDDTSLLVVGSRGRGGVTGLLLGSVSQSLLRHSRCPVAVVRRQVAAD
ncbi:nucleotide-binding universal stress UspA family protein [Kribbella orskensis]|uniref:Nucleotide-binding universal stress UspA family protein n=1 Tax=Kribbella orskensis TaxID=2512216 RepID=A0ABY2BP85_9ACTN|nr:MULTISPECIES: universal stress protein [Kribbella]TCN42200.1 nucleotide-binding universal stress UspA family protein [Kribbella sp. VKM Ac-2500]TCO26078.1 nucleotide-binding universal stress UspA family protein [Kribbella orskensis]